MLTTALGQVVAHTGAGRGPHDLWAEWHVDPVLLGGLLLTVLVHDRGASRRGRRFAPRSLAFAGALLVLALALLSPLDVLAGELASAHMVQHILILVVAAPLLAVSRPTSTLVAGCPRIVRRAVLRSRRRLRHVLAWADGVRTPIVAWLVHAGVVWFWHASVPYESALRNDLVHDLEHLSFVLAGLLLWSTVVHVRRLPEPSYGVGALLVFTTALQSVFLSVLLTFATRPWYESYLATAPAWGLDALADQHLAGVIMWVPAGFVYVGAGVLLVSVWLRNLRGPAGARDRDGNWGEEPASSSATPV